MQVMPRDAAVRAIRIDDEILRPLNEQAPRENIPLTRLIDRTLRAGLSGAREPSQPRQRHREVTHAMGTPAINLDKALALAAMLENELCVGRL